MPEANKTTRRKTRPDDAEPTYTKVEPEEPLPPFTAREFDTTKKYLVLCDRRYVVPIMAERLEQTLKDRGVDCSVVIVDEPEKTIRIFKLDA